MIYLAKHGWLATGIDFAAPAIRTARRNAKRTRGARFIQGDATRLTRLGIAAPIDLALDMECSTLPQASKPLYVKELAALLTPALR